MKLIIKPATAPPSLSSLPITGRWLAILKTPARCPSIMAAIIKTTAKIMEYAMLPAASAATSPADITGVAGIFP